MAYASLNTEICVVYNASIKGVCKQIIYTRMLGLSNACNTFKAADVAAFSE